MGYSIMPQLKEPTVCEIICLHNDCKYWKEFINSAKCKICKNKIKSGEAYYNTDDELEHFKCINLK